MQSPFAPRKPRQERVTFPTPPVPLVLDGSWKLDGTQTLNGIKTEYPSTKLVW